MAFENPYSNLFTPLRVRNLILKNRIMSAPNMLFQTVDGRPNDYYVGYLEHKARGGAAIVTLGEAAVCDGGCHTPMMEMTHDNRSLYGEMAAAIHEHGAIASVELVHGGQLARPFFNKDTNKIFGPSADPNFMNEGICREMTEEDMEEVAEAHAAAAEYYFDLGFDTALIHAGHGWLLSQFLSPFRNKRTDQYGGSFENRMRFPLYVLRKVRERVGPKRALLMRVSGSERMEGGFTTQDIITFLEKAQEYVDLAEVSTEGFPYTFAGTYMQPGQNVPFAEEIKKSDRVKIPIYTIGSINSPDLADDIIASGKADGVSISRAIIADPYFPKKAALGLADEITPCLRCSTCTGSDNLNRHFICSVNPRTSRESRIGFGDSIGKAEHQKRVLVVGGGPAGITAAVTAAERGHEVKLVEKSESLGGWLRFADTDSLKHDVKRYKDYMIRQIEKSNVVVELGTEADTNIVESFAPDNIIVACGSQPISPTFIPGWEKALHATAAYFDPDSIKGQKIAIIGGGLIGVEAGLHLSSNGKDVTVLEMQDEYAVDSMPAYKWGLELKVAELNMQIVTSAKVTQIEDNGVRYTKDGEEVLLEADTILYAVGMAPTNGEYFDLHDKAPLVTLIGDAQKVGKLDGAIHSGFFAAMDIGDI